MPLLALIFGASWWAWEDPQTKAMVVWLLSAGCAVLVCLTWLLLGFVVVRIFDSGFKLATAGKRKRGR